VDGSAGLGRSLIDVAVTYTNTLIVRFEILSAVKISMLAFWIVTPCGLVGTQGLRRSILPPRSNM
jgi:hypothetical protein